MSRRHARLHAASGRRADRRRRLAEGQARQAQYAAGVPPVRLCRHRQDDACEAHCPGRRRRGAVRRLHRQGRAGHAQQGLPRRLHHPQPDLSHRREQRRDADLRIVARRARRRGEAHHHRRMLDGRCGDGQGPDVVRRAAARARRSGAIAAGPGRRLLHGLRARRHAHRGAPAGAGRSDRAAVHGHPRRPPARARQDRPHRGRTPDRPRSAARARSRPGAGRPQCDAPRLQHAHARAPRLRGGAAASPATSSSACATTAARACSTADCGA